MARSKGGIKWSIADLVDELVAKHGDREGLVFVDDGSGKKFFLEIFSLLGLSLSISAPENRKRSYTFRELDQEANRGKLRSRSSGTNVSQSQLQIGLSGLGLNQVKL